MKQSFSEMNVLLTLNVLNVQQIRGKIVQDIIRAAFHVLTIVSDVILSAMFNISQYR